MPSVLLCLRWKCHEAGWRQLWRSFVRLFFALHRWLRPRGSCYQTPTTNIDIDILEHQLHPQLTKRQHRK